MIHALSFEGRAYGYRVTAVARRINPAQPNYYQGSYHIHSLTCTCYIYSGEMVFGGNDFRGKWSSGEMIYYRVVEGSSVCGRQKANHGLCEVSGLCI